MLQNTPNHRIEFWTQLLRQRIKQTRDNLDVDPEEKFYENKMISISQQEYLDIVELVKFLNEQTEINDEALDLILSSNSFYFKTLNDVYKVIPNLIEEARLHNDEKYIPYMYISQKIYGDNAAATV